MSIKKIQVELAETPLKQRQGLMGRKRLPKDYGMLFDFGKEQELDFWMYNTYLPLQIAFIKSDGTIGNVQSMVPQSTKTIRSNGNYRYALEMPDGWFDENKVKNGSKLGIFAQEAPVAGEEQQQPETSSNAYDVVITQSFKDIIKRADELGFPLVIDYVTDEGNDMPPTLIEPPFEFLATEDGDQDGRVLAYNFQNFDYGTEEPGEKDSGLKSYIIENIKVIRDPDNKINIVNVQQLEELAKKYPMGERE